MVSIKTTIKTTLMFLFNTRNVSGDFTWCFIRSSKPWHLRASFSKWLTCACRCFATWLFRPREYNRLQVHSYFLSWVVSPKGLPFTRPVVSTSFEFSFLIPSRILMWMVLLEMSDCIRCDPCWWHTLGSLDKCQGRITITLRTPLIIREWIDTNMRTICIYWTIRQAVFVDTLQMLTHRRSSSSFPWTVSADRLISRHTGSCRVHRYRHTLLPSPWSHWQTSEFEQLYVMHWQFLDQERLTRSTVPVWNQSWLIFGHNKPFPYLPFPRLRCLLYCSFHDRNEINEVKFRVSVSRKLWNENEVKCLDDPFPTVEVKWDEVKC